MAITVSLLGTPTFNTTSGTKTVTATPAVGDLIIIITAHSGNTSAAAPTDNQTGGTYTLVNSAVKATSADTMRVWVRNNLITSATSTVFTHAPGTTTGGGLVVIDCQGMDKAGSSAIVQSAIRSNQAAGTPAPVFGTAPNSQNAIIGAVFNASNPAALTPRTNFTELYDSGYNTPATGLEVMSDNSGETSATITWGSSSATAYAAIVVELEASVTHATTGTLTGQIGSVSGSATRNTSHATTGTLTGQIGSVSGNATRFRAFASSGTLTGQGSTVTGDADRESAAIAHITDGVLTGQGSTVTGSATSFTVFTTSGALTGQGSVVTGDADREAAPVPHTTEGVLVGQGSSLAGNATRYRQFSTTGNLVADGAVITGTVFHYTHFETSGVLVGQGSVITGDADHVSLRHDATGELTGQGSEVSGNATRYREFSVTGNLVGEGSIIVGSAAIVVNVAHDTSGSLVGSGSSVSGEAFNGTKKDVIGGTRRIKPSIIVVSVDGKDYRVPETQLQAFLETLQQKIEDSPPVQKKRKKKGKKRVEVVEVKEVPEIIVKSAPVSIIPQVQNEVDKINSIISQSFNKALENYLLLQAEENIQIEIANKKKRMANEEAIILMLL